MLINTKGTLSDPADPHVAELAAKGYQEVGSSGLQTYGGFISEAYNRELEWPGVAPLYNRIWRSDPELAIVRMLFEAWSGQQEITAYVPEEVPGKDLGAPTDDDKRAADFYQSVIEDVQGGISRWFSSCVTRVPFYGWGWWEVVPGLRNPKWRPPNDDPWRSDYDDDLVGYRQIAFRRYSSFDSWEINDQTGRWTGINQLDPPNPPVTIPLGNSLHVLFGDMDNPEGLATMETLWRLERYKYNLELIQGMGYEHAAGHAYFEGTKKFDSEDHAVMRKAARAVATAQEGNYIALPEHIKFHFEDVNFQAGANILEAIRYYSILKLAVWGAQWVAMATIAGTGAYSAVQDASQNSMNVYNSMAEGFLTQADAQIGGRLFDYPVNKAAFLGMTRRPRLQVSPVRRLVDIQQLGQFLTAIAAVMQLSVEDLNAIRAESGILPPVSEDELELVEQTPDDETMPDDEPDLDEETEIVDEGEPEADAEMVYHLQEHTGVMVALYLPQEVARQYVLTEPDPDVPGFDRLRDGALPEYEMHVTLAYLGDVTEQKKSKKTLLRLVQVLAARTPEIAGRINGHGRFTETHIEGKEAIWLSVDAPTLPAVREMLLRTLDYNGFKVASDHGFQPHITLAYVNSDEQVDFDFQQADVTFAHLAVAWGEEVFFFSLLGEEVASDEPMTERALVFRPFIVSDREQPITLDAEAEITEKDVNRAVRKFKKWADKNEPDLAKILDAKVLL